MRVETKEQVEQLLSQANGLYFRTLGPVEMRLPHLSPDQNYEHEIKFNELGAVCGCRTSTFLALACAIGYELLMGYIGWDTLTYLNISGMIAAFVAGGIVGKIIGLTPERRKLRLLLSAMLWGFPETNEEA